MVSAMAMCGAAVEARCPINKAGISTRQSRAVRARAPQRCVLPPTCSYSSEREPLLITASQPLLAPRSVFYYGLCHFYNGFVTHILPCVTSMLWCCAILWHRFNFFCPVDGCFFCRTQDMAGDPFGLLLRQRIVFLGGEVRIYLRGFYVYY